MKDYLVRGLIDKRNARVFACRTTNLVNDARTHHHLWPCASAALGRLMSVTLMMGAMNKNNEKMTVTMNGGGPMGTLLVTSNSDGKIKGFVSNPEVHYTYNKTNKLAVGLCVGTQGDLQVIRDMGLKQPITSSVPIQTGEIGDDFAYYFMVSEQIPSVVSLGVLVNEDSIVEAAGGFIIQLLPEATEEDITFIENKIKDFPPVSALIKEGKSPEDIIEMLFGNEAEILDHQGLSFYCDCSKEKMTAALATVPNDELEAMIKEDHGAEITCQFCNRHYHFDEQELLDIKNKNRQQR